MAEYTVVRKGKEFPETLLQTMKDEYGVTVLSQDRNIILVEMAPANADQLREHYPVELEVEENLPYERASS